MYKHRIFKQLIISIFVLLIATNIKAQKISVPQIKSMDEWVDSTYNTMTDTERLGQLIVIRANSNANKQQLQDIETYLTKYGVSGVCFFKGHPIEQIKLTKKFQSLSKIPLFISMDAEWGAAMRLDSVTDFPKQMTIGAVQDKEVVYKWAKAIAMQLKELGVNVSFSPVADINSNPRNPVINTRSFGESKTDVAEKGIIYMQALQEQGIMSVAKHFPGHGDTHSDSHYSLPVINKSAANIDTLELFPFKTLIQSGIQGVMVGHLNIPSLDPTQNNPSSLSKSIITDLLRKKLNFKGLIFTDGLEMKGVTDYAKPGELEVKAILAGNDMLLLPQSVDAAMRELQKALDKNIISKTELEEKCKRILSYKYLISYFYTNSNKANDKEVQKSLNLDSDAMLVQEVYENSITLLKNKNNLLPLQNIENMKVATLCLGKSECSSFCSDINNYVKNDCFDIDEKSISTQKNSLLEQLKNYNLVIINFGINSINSSKNYYVSSEMTYFIDLVIKNNRTVFVLYGIPYSLNVFRNINSAESIIVAYQNNEYAMRAASQLIVGAKGFSGKLPVNVNAIFTISDGFETEKSDIISQNPYYFSQIPEAQMQEIDNIIEEGISKKAYPGCQLTVLKDGEAIINKSYGNTDYINKKPVTPDMIYDIASITKITSTTLAMMKLYELNRYELNDKLSEYLTYLKNTNKKHITFKEILAHQAGLKEWIDFSKMVSNKGVWDDTKVQSKYSEDFPIKVADNMFISRQVKQAILDSIIKSPLIKQEYKYSDLGMILLQEYIEQTVGCSLEKFVDSMFYKPLGLQYATYNPLSKFDKSQIVPTENDNIFRKQTIQGFVHDPTAALLGGASGHAGVFSNSMNIATIMQMLIQNGTYNGKTYFKPETVHAFNSRPYKHNRRGLGFDKRQIKANDPGPASNLASSESFGHTGFTGTFTWADPENKLVIVFLSNRVNPSAEPNTLLSLGTRTRLQTELYKIFNNNK